MDLTALKGHKENPYRHRSYLESVHSSSLNSVMMNKQSDYRNSTGNQSPNHWLALPDCLAHNLSSTIYQHYDNTPRNQVGKLLFGRYCNISVYNKILAPSVTYFLMNNHTKNNLANSSKVASDIIV